MVKIGKVDGLPLLILVLMFSMITSSPANLPATCNHTNDSWNNATTQNPTTAGAAGVLYQWLEFFEENVTWTESMDTEYFGYIFDKTTLADLQQGIANLTSWYDILIWSARTRKFGIENQTKIQWALDNAEMLPDGSLPYSTTNPSDGNPGFGVGQRELLYGYYWAVQYDYDLAKWNLTKAYGNFRTAWQNTGHGFLYYENTSITYTIGYGPRYYDECAETIACFLLFYEFNITSALADAQTEWAYVNNNLWKNDPPQHYMYALSRNDWECEAGGFLEICAWLGCYNSSLANATNVITDFQSRFLSNEWQSYQWTTDPSTPNYCVIHASPTNSERRLGNTIMAWASILGAFDSFSSAAKRNVTNLLSGFDGYSPAWYLLMNSSCDLYNTGSCHFRGTSTNPDYTNQNTALAATLMFVMGIVPINATLAVPIEELHYEYVYNMLDHDLFNINLTARSVTLSIGKAGTVGFQFNSTIYCSFSKDGVYRVEFNSDWSNVTIVARIGDLPSNRKYLFQAFSNVPEFPLFLTLPFLMIATLLAVIVCRRRLVTRQKEAGWFHARKINA
jgi:hypothetical protein